MARTVTAGAVMASIGGMFLACAAPTHTSAVVTCQEQKLIAQGELELCLKKNSAEVLGGGTDQSATCQMEFSAALTQAGTVCRYLDNGDGTVTDLNTGLQWEKKDNLDGVVNDADPHDADNLYTWTASGMAADGTAYTDFLSKLNNGAFTGCFANHCDWRLPRHVELQGIVDETKGVCGGGSGACIDPAFGPTQLLYYYYSSAVARRRQPDRTRGGVCFGLCRAPEWPEWPPPATPVDSANKVIGVYVRAVRGGL